MGTYDTLHDGDRYEQVKLWGKGLRHLHVGDRVGLPRGGLGPSGTYTVVMRAGGYVHVVDGVLTAWEDQPGAGPQLMTGGGRFLHDEWPGGPFGPWYRNEEAPASRRVTVHADRECPRSAGASLRLVRGDDPESGLDLARAVARAAVAARLDAEPDDGSRVAAARAYLADRTGYLLVSCEAAAALLGVAEEPERAGTLLVEVLSTVEPGGPEWRNAAALLKDVADVLPSAAVAESLRLLAAALPVPDAPAAPPSDAADAAQRPGRRRRRMRAASRDEDRLAGAGRYGDLDFQGAAEAAVARHGAAVLPAIPLTFWGRDIVDLEIAASLLAPILGRELTRSEMAVLLWAVLSVPGTVETLDEETLVAALQRALGA
ncbi:hypothetical protein [Modestobacter sp. VKM Ac-2984]|uniref:hypothetical protein n=1 Tax=Modestobacter sp. VKM Ac-2984 TaxID=3004138 RepID=UPI0022AA7262|nr:hypothetical protein [Modestobacter sp. VKM Ac-2984]MCZ2817263.1 hypothetical protein [Modestobacter sp. VKM Ac-2984]